MQQYTAYLVSCVSSKCARAAPAKDLYDSHWFKKARRYAEASGCPWFVLSAKYGLVAPNKVIAPYNTALNVMSARRRRQWASDVMVQLDQCMPRLKKVVFLAGKRYREFLIASLKARKVLVAIPMEGLGIGEQLRWLSHRNENRNMHRKERKRNKYKVC